MTEFSKMDSLHFDVLREIGNIGSGHAVTALAKMLNKKVDMSVPSVNLVEFKDIANFLGGGDSLIIGILVNITGDINGIMMFIVRHDTARKLLSIVMGREDNTQEPTEFSEIELSALTEIGNILAGSYLGSLSSLINKKVLPSVPALAIDMANAILSVPAIEFGKVADLALLIESVFQADDENVSGYFLLVPDLQSYEVILSALGVQ